MDGEIRHASELHSGWGPVEGDRSGSEQAHGRLELDEP